MNDTRALVISSTGKHFCAGMALDVFGGGNALLSTGTARARLNFQGTLRRLIKAASRRLLRMGRSRCALTPMS